MASPAADSRACRTRFRCLRQTRELAAPIYFTETRALIYQPPLDVRYLESPPVPWLSPGRPRPRLPTALEEPFRRQRNRGVFQWVVPAGGVPALVGDRAGILLARLRGSRRR